MRVITAKMVQVMAARDPAAANSLARWLELAGEARWRRLSDVRRVFPHADEVKVESGRGVVIFNIAGNKYRLITAMHYDRDRIFVRMLLSHAEYSKDRWKGQL